MYYKEAKMITLYIIWLSTWKTVENSQKILITIKKLSKVAVYELNIHNSITFLYTKNNQVEIKWKKDPTSSIYVHIYAHMLHIDTYIYVNSLLNVYMHVHTQIHIIYICQNLKNFTGVIKEN